MPSARAIASTVIVLAALPGTAVAQANAAIYQIQAGGCPGLTAGQVRPLTGFHLQGQPGILTALHGVVGCTSLDALQNGQMSAASLQIGAVDVPHDAALLVGPTFNAASASLSARVPSVQPGASLQVLGYPLGLPHQLASDLKVRSPAEVPLVFLVSGSAYMALSARRSPDVSTKVLSIEGHLLPGHSGAPVMDSNGKVVGIANGGLERGAVEISWVVPIGGISLAPVASAQVELARLVMQGDERLFALDLAPPSNVATVSCFGMTLHPVRAVGLSELTSTVDDPVTYEGLMHAYDLDGSGTGFIIYRSERGEVTLVVPEGWSVASNQLTTCVATAPDGAGIDINYQYKAAPPGAGINSINNWALGIEYSNICSAGFTLDPSFSNLFARTSFQRGLITQRRTFAQIDRRCGPMGLQWPGGPPPIWPNLPVPGQTPQGYFQCQAMPCSSGYTPQVWYPDAWAQPSASAQFIHGWAFGSYVMSQRRGIAVWMKWQDPSFASTLASCALFLTVSPACEQAFEEQQTWARGVIAATASTISK